MIGKLDRLPCSENLQKASSLHAPIFRIKDIIAHGCPKKACNSGIQEAPLVVIAKAEAKQCLSQMYLRCQKLSMAASGSFLGVIGGFFPIFSLDSCGSHCRIGQEPSSNKS